MRTHESARVRTHQLVGSAAVMGEVVVGLSRHAHLQEAP